MIVEKDNQKHQIGYVNHVTMKKTFLVLTACLLILAGSAHAQTDRDRNIVIKINPISLFLFTGNAQVEAAISNRVSLQLGAFYSGISVGGGIAGASGRIGYRVYAFTPEARFYMGAEANAPNGFYVAPYARILNGEVNGYGYVSIPSTGTEEYASIRGEVLGIGGGVNIGYQLVTDFGLTVEAFIGPQYLSGDFEFSAECSQCDGTEIINPIGRRLTGATARLGLTIGYAF